MLRESVQQKNLDAIIESLALKETYNDKCYQAASRDDYFKLVQAALDGKLDGEVSVSRSGIYRHEFLVTPPSDI